jgi:hypothetical protein
MRSCRLCTMIVFALVASAALTRPAAGEFGASEQHAKLTAISKKIQRILDDVGGHLAGAAKELGKPGLAGPDAERILDDLCRKQPYFACCATVDASGVILTDRPELNRKYEGTDISDQEHIKLLMSTQRPVMSGLFKAVEGYHAVEFGWPVFDRKKKFIGAVSAIVRPREFLEGIIEPMLSWDAFTIWVLQENGVALFSKDRSLEGEDLDDVIYYTKKFRYKPLLERIENERSGSMRYMKEGTGHSTSRPRQFFWESVEFKENRWRVVLSGPAQ